MFYNANGELDKSITIKDEGVKVTTTTTHYYYDAFGRRIAKSSSVKKSSKLGLKGNVPKFGLVSYEKPIINTMLMLWDGNRQVQEYTTDHVFTTVYEQDSFEPVARIVQLSAQNEKQRVADGVVHVRRYVPSGIITQEVLDNIEKAKQPLFKIYHYHCNHLGTPQELSDDKGDIVWLSYDRAWGESFDKFYKSQFIDNYEILAEQLQPFKFQGQFFDTETGFHYNRFRYYDSDVGMFISRDPIGLLGGDNVFQYAPNPVMWIDPFGLISIHDIALNKAKQLKISQGINDATKISVVRDKVTGKTYTGISGNPYQKISKGLERYLPTKSRTDWKVKNCAEVDALNKAFKARPGANMKDMKIVTITIRNNTNKEPCGNCSITTRNASVEKFKYEVEDVENFSGCNH